MMNREGSQMGSKEARILIIDDDKEFAQGLAEHMTESGYSISVANDGREGLDGYSISVAHDGREGLDKFRKGDFHVVLTDLQMPVMDGMELLHEIKRQDNRSVVVVITGFGTIEAAVRATKEGAYDFIAKPIKFDQLDVVFSGD